MLNGDIWFNGQPASEYGVRHVERFPEFDRPERKADVFEIPGRNGSIVFMQNAWSDIEKSYDIYTGDGSRGSAPRDFCKLSTWLNSIDGYGRLEDSYEPDIFRLAYCLGAYETENTLNKHGRATLTFQCRPERFLKSGEEKIVYGYGGSYPPYPEIYNPTPFWAKPLIFVQSSIGADADPIVFENLETGKEFTINWADIAPSMGLFVDSETMDVYSETGANYNSFVDIEEFPQLGPGLTRVFTSSQYKVEIVPRWFYL